MAGAINTNTIDSEVFFRMLEEASDMDEFHRMIDEYNAKRVSESAEKAKPEFKPKAEPKAKPADGSEAFIKGVARSAKKISGGRNIDPTAEGSLRRMVSSLPNEAPYVDGKGVSKSDERAKPFTESFNKEMSEKHFNETSAEPTSNSTVKNSVGNKLKNSKVGNWLKNTKVGSYFTDSPLTPMNVALTYKGWTGQANPVAYAVNTYGMGANGGYMPVGEHTLDQLRIQHGKDELSNQGTTVPINPQGTLYLDPELGIVDTQVLEDEDGIRYYRNARTGHFEALDSDAPYKYYNPKKPTFNDILNGVLSMPKSDTPLPVPPMHYDNDANKPLPPVSADTDEGEIPSGTVVVGPDTETPTLDTIFKRINNGRDLAKLGTDNIVHNSDTSIDDAYANQSNISNMSTIPTNMSTPILDITPRPSNTNTNTNIIPTATTPTVATNAISQRNASRMQPKSVTPTVTTPVVPKASVKQSVPVEEVTLGSIINNINKAPLVRRNGGFDEYRRQSALAALRNAGGISPAEGVQRGIIPYEALQYI